MLLVVAGVVAVLPWREPAPGEPTPELVPLSTPEASVADAGPVDEALWNEDPAGASAVLVDDGVPPPDGPPPPHVDEPPCTVAELPTWWDMGEDAPRPSAAAFVRARVRAEWLGQGGWSYSVGGAAASGFNEGADHVTLIAEYESRRDSYALFSVRGVGPEYEGLPGREAVYLARVESEDDPDEAGSLDPDGGVFRRYRRLEARRLYDFALDPDEAQGDCEASAADELRVRDIDGDGLREVTAIFTRVASGIYNDGSEECGAVAFLMSGDLRIQARITRELHMVRYEASGETFYDVTTLWRLADTNGDGHADLHLVETMRYRDDFQGDYVGDGETAPAQHSRDQRRTEADCPYVPTLDTWRCTPEGAGLGQGLFRGAGTVLRPPRR